MKKIVSLFLCLVVLILSCLFVALYPQSDTENEDGIILLNGHLTEVENPMNTQMLDYACKLFTRIYDEQLEDNKCYFSLVPDKYRYLADKESEFIEFSAYISAKLPFVTMIDLVDLLDENDYYCTDMHWRQEQIVDVAKRINDTIGVECDYTFGKVFRVSHFVGNYAQRSDIEVAADDLVCLTNETIDKIKIKENIPVCDLEKLYTPEPYEVFLSGNQSVVTMINENAENDRRLVVFRDSFASSLAPLLVSGYSEVVLVDLRYVMSDMLNDYVDFDKADVLFLYSTTLLNNSFSMK